MSDKAPVITNAPLYANVYATLVPIARQYGYALAVHGSMARDLDLIAVPWVNAADVRPPDEMIRAFCAAVYFTHIDGPELKPNGRQTWTLAFPGTCFVDLSIMPTIQ